MAQVQENPEQIVEAAIAVEKQKKRRSRAVGIFSTAMITRRVPLNIIHIGDNIKQTLEKKVAFDIEGKCIVDGYVKPGTCRVQSYSSGELSSNDVMFDVVIQCEVCCPVEGMHIVCLAKNITESAGIKAETEDDPSPVVIYVARDHHFNNPNFSKVKPGDKIKVRVIGQRYELNDPYISVIAELVEDKAVKYGKKKKLVIKD